MSQPVIKASALGKRYTVGGTPQHLKFDTLRESLAGLWRHKKGVGNDEGMIWALRGVSFEVAPGEVVGMIGHNGAGKSTLLKMLSRITEPTEGMAEIEGRVGSLLDVGTGFHPELTGRENIYLNGAILGMKRAEIDRRFDEIVSFAETEAFLDTPVKWYSSGMYMRLAFAVAAHLEPDILIIDEVLVVGDAAFQKKGLGKVGDFARQGRTVLFVSHNLGAIRSLCSRAMVFNAGRLEFDGATEKAISFYLTSTAARIGDNDGRVVFGANRPQSADLALREIRLLDAAGMTRGLFDAADSIRVEIEYEVKTRLRGARTTLHISTQEGEQAFVSTDHMSRDPEQPPGRYCTACTIPGGLLNQRMYMVGISVEIPGVRQVVPRQDHLAFMVSGGGNHGSTFPEDWPGVVCPVLEWKTNSV